MLTELRIANFAVIDQLTLRFSGGFHAFTGETGAGKSILVDALALLVGGRASTEGIRTEAEEAEIEAAFDLQGREDLLARFRESGVLEPRDTELIVRRVIARNGRNRVYLNGRLTPLHVLESLAGTMLDLHGQHDQQSLLSAQTQLDALDTFGDILALRHAYGKQYAQWRARAVELEAVTTRQREREQREDYVGYLCRELEDAGLAPGEEEALESEHARLAHAKRLRDLSEEAYDLLYGSEASVLKGLSLAEDRVSQVASVDRDMDEWTRVCRESAVQLQELAHHLRDYLHHLEQDPERLVRVEERLQDIQRLKRKHGGSFEQLLARAAELRAELDQLQNTQGRQEELVRLLEQDAGEVRELAGKLSEARMSAARQLETRVRQELRALRMEATRFQAVVRSGRDLAACTGTGWDRVEYLISANPGEPPLPLARTASGGELSRIMLAIKTVLAERDAVPILVFDEIDAGVGGAVADVMGQRLRTLGKHHQVFCITHLPQVASKAEHHFVVEKLLHQKRTVTRVRHLDRPGREAEVARMLGGLTITSAVRQTAAEMLGSAKQDR